MLEELIKNKVYYKIFNLTHTKLTHKYIIKNPEDLNHTREVQKNKEEILKEFQADKLLLLNQVHGNDVITDENFTYDKLPKGDAAITSKKHIVLGIFTADCVPVLFTSEDGSIIGAAHCGWRGAKADIIAKVAKTMHKRGANKLKAVIGPSIAQSSYEVSSVFYKDFTNLSAEFRTFFLPSVKTEHYMFDLPGFVKHKLGEAGIEIISHINEDTYRLREKYPSFRRATHTNELDNPQNILSAIMIN